MTRRRSKTKRSGSGHGRLGMGCGRPSSVPLRHLVAPETTTPPPPLQQQQQPHTHWILSLSFPCQHGCHYYNCCHCQYQPWHRKQRSFKCLVAHCGIHVRLVPIVGPDTWQWPWVILRHGASFAPCSITITIIRTIRTIRRCKNK